MQQSSRRRFRLASFVMATACLHGALAGAQQGITKPAITPQAPAAQMPRAIGVVSPNVDASYVIGPDDQIQVVVWKEQNLSGALLVRPDGMVTLPLIGDVKAAGMTPTALAEDLAGKLKKFVSDPLVTVTILAVNSKRVYMLGEVIHVGPLPLTPGLTPLQAIAEVGGLTPYAHAKAIYILRVTNGKQQKIPFDYKKAIKSGGQSIELMPGDNIIVP